MLYLIKLAVEVKVSLKLILLPAVITKNASACKCRDESVSQLHYEEKPVLMKDLLNTCTTRLVFQTINSKGHNYNGLWYHFTIQNRIILEASEYSSSFY